MNAAILSDSGGPCPDNSVGTMEDGLEVQCNDPDWGFNFFFDPTGAVSRYRSTCMYAYVFMAALVCA